MLLNFEVMPIILQYSVDKQIIYKHHVVTQFIIVQIHSCGPYVLWNVVTWIAFNRGISLIP